MLRSQLDPMERLDRSAVVVLHLRRPLRRRKRNFTASAALLTTIQSQFSKLQLIDSLLTDHSFHFHFRFYVGCDMCNNWFHGQCVGINEAACEKIDEFICEGCKHAQETKELYCLCKQPYDESQFYICCDKCQDWFHGRCVGVLQKEADNIDEYTCPNCTKNDSVSSVNMKLLTPQEFEHLKRLMKQISAHKSAWPFLEAVDPQEAPDYYKVIKEPMDLNKVETRIDTKWYTTLAQFIGDMTKIFDNCRYYNPKESQFYRCAETLEAFFLGKIKFFRENIVDKC